ncbi:hypothetical protein CK203_005771 [Vitis vinifera]|uniref:Uncharacterized protein n=1 Tax=Vitis vinifera TaxID=29760 RepID=A0A438K3Q3_VITVI|nr:hypothetical protein CK203_005771 [Vitis vinifera]
MCSQRRRHSHERDAASACVSCREHSDAARQVRDTLIVRNRASSTGAAECWRPFYIFVRWSGSGSWRKRGGSLDGFRSSCFDGCVVCHAVFERLPLEEEEGAVQVQPTASQSSGVTGGGAGGQLGDGGGSGGGAGVPIYNMGASMGNFPFPGDLLRWGGSAPRPPF